MVGLIEYTCFDHFPQILAPKEGIILPECHNVVQMHGMVWPSTCVLNRLFAGQGHVTNWLASLATQPYKTVNYFELSNVHKITVSKLAILLISSRTFHFWQPLFTTIYFFMIDMFRFGHVTLSC